jgi:2-(1,2-epoxy-1,2-dihydrophenyl)acetyl-CoA isomerase
VLRLATQFHGGLEALAALDAPVICAVRGAAAGGGMSLAIACDIVLAAESARFTMAYTAIGFPPDGGSSWTLPRLVGRRRAAELMLLNERLDAPAALDLGLVTRVVPDAALDAEAAALARRLADGPTHAHGAVKRLLRESATRGFAEQMAEEARTIAALAAAPDGREGVAAFLEKRAPAFGR